MSNWHDRHLDDRTPGDRVADKVAEYMGSWKFIILQSAIVVVWMLLNTAGWFIWHWDKFPFILLNLMFSTQAAYAAPIIMMAQNRAGERDRANAQHDYEVNLHNRDELAAIRALLEDTRPDP